MNTICNLTVGYYPIGCIIDGPLNPRSTIAAIDLVPASQQGNSHAMEVGGPTFRDNNSISPGTSAITAVQTAATPNGGAPVSNISPERRSTISAATPALASQSHSGGVIENAGIVRGHNTGHRTSLPAEEFEANISRLIERLTIQGVDRAIVGLCSGIFAQGVSLEALKARMTRKECEKHGLRNGMRYRMLLDLVKMTKDGVPMDRHVCRLCRRGEAVDYKNHRDALRHLLRDHFGIGFECTQWSVFPSLFDLYPSNM